ncbi:CpaF family protein [Hyphomicrobium sp. CS1GBMeth3]|uniref:CpaF family protein n=1 Tax=Hyphomicrobium sp. CS1GBMeth3 TaxID=1892845 RepID=UPI000931DF15|nr:CpaF family protein [Hyphomicrobium sp. CS1GBMeth3]
MFGRRTSDPGQQRRVPQNPAAPATAPAPQPAPKTAAPPPPPPPPREEPVEPQRHHSEEYYDVKTTVFNALIDTIDLTQLAKLDSAAAREEIRDIVSEIIQVKNVVMSIAEQEELLEDICNDVLGYGPLEPLLARDDIADIMVNGAATTFIEVGGKTQKTGVRFADNQQLMNICQRIVSQVGRRVDESSPICDARLPDGSRVNVIAPPLAIDGPVLTIRKFRKDRLTLDQLMRFGAITPQAKTILEVIGRVRCNVLISGGTGSGKTTLLNCLTGCIDSDERIITCEDSAELQLQQPHVVRLETRPPNLEGEGEITMRDLVKNCLRMRPERIIVGEVRGPEAFDLLQAMNTGHDGSMGTLHANSPREALSRLESMIMMGGFTLPIRTIREMIVGSIDIIIQAARLRDGSRKVTHITEVVGMEDDIITLQNLIVYEITGEDAYGRLTGHHRSTGIARPAFWERAQYYKEEGRLAGALAAAEMLDANGTPMGETQI